MAAAAYGGPIAGKAVGFLAPKALEHVSNTPIEDIKAHKSPFSKEAIKSEGPEIVIHVQPAERATLAGVARANGAKLKLHCHTGPEK
jgi:hypothetical protein